MSGQVFGYDVKEFKAEHIHLDEIREHERMLITSLGAMSGPRLKLLENSGPGWSIFKNGLFVAAGGAVPLFGVTAELWQFPSTRVLDFTLSYCKLFEAFVDGLSADFARLQTVCLDDQLHNRWMRFLGFEKEGVMRRYGHDQKDYAMYARVS